VASSAAFWEDAPEVLAGRDLEAGGTWAGVTSAGRFAVVTNYREGLNPPKAKRSRGELVAEFLRGNVSAHDYVEQLRGRQRDYGAFSFLCGDRRELHYVSNRDNHPGPVSPGIHGLSNHLLDTPWPKVERSRAGLGLLLEQSAVSSGALLRLLQDRQEAGTAELPDTGIGVELEQRVSAPFVVNPVYGTRCSTAIRLHVDGSLRFAERVFTPTGEALETRYFHVTYGAT
jgi:uncharacterized protein with NRDE domain